MNELAKRKPLRLKGYDYSQPGAYFITICVKERQEKLGKIVGAAFCRPCIELTHEGRIVEEWIGKISIHYPCVQVLKYTIMPNHVHLILDIQNSSITDAFGRQNAAPTQEIGRVMGYFKYQTTKEINVPGFWQRSYYDHVIHNEDDYLRVWRYIDENQAKWQEDRYYGKEKNL